MLKEPKRDAFGIKCPICGNDKAFGIKATVYIDYQAYQRNDLRIEGNYFNNKRKINISYDATNLVEDFWSKDWTEKNTLICYNCGHEGLYGELNKEYQDFYKAFEKINSKYKKD